MDVDRGHSTAQVSGKKLDRIILVVLALALGYFAFDKFVLDPVEDEQIAQSARQEGRTDALTESYGDKSIAVLPFADMSPNGDQEYFGDGIAEELLNELVLLDGLHVAGRTSSFSFKGRNEDLKMIGEALDVGTILEGSIRKSGNRVRITAQLIDAIEDVHLLFEDLEQSQYEAYSNI